ncbi:MAG: response regulator [Anaerolineae bacterium]|nr:response regulator [Anaerolineae bacterium]
MSNSQDLPESFVEQVKEALEKLYNFQALQENSLTRKFNSQASDTRTTGAHQLRAQLIEAIETLNPGQNVAAHSSTARIYNLIYMHYIGRLTIQQAAWEVGVSLRQAYRDLRYGQELVSAVLWHKLHTEVDSPQQVTSINAELTRLSDNTTVAALQEMLDSAVRPIQILADKYNIAIQIEAPASPIMLTTNLVIAQQILTHVLSQIIQQVRPPSLNIQLLDNSHFMRMHYAVDGQSPLHIKPIIQQMMDQINWELQCSAAEGTQEICLKSGQRKALILLIDDNEGLIHLLQRYLTDDAYTLMSVPNTEDGLQIIQQLQPDAIILDVMMPGIDGWELLQRLRTRAETKFIPVIICSVINDSELAFALGASQYVPKPVTREALLLALQKLRV